MENPGTRKCVSCYLSKAACNYLRSICNTCFESGMTCDYDFQRHIPQNVYEGNLNPTDYSSAWAWREAKSDEKNRASRALLDEGEDNEDDEDDDGDVGITEITQSMQSTSLSASGGPYRRRRIVPHIGESMANPKRRVIYSNRQEMDAF
ncbi:hypothetical protein PSPO01_01549 [Paraphaeosphaeria sporulosa]